MKIKDLVKTAAVYLAEEKVLEYLENGEYATDGNVLVAVDYLTRCANTVINELSSTYIPLVKKEKAISENGKIYFSSLKETALELVNVYNLNGDKAEFDFHPDYIEIPCGEWVIEYKYLPYNLGLEDDTGYKESVVGTRIIAYAVASEYLLLKRNFEESVLWRNRYTDALSKIIKPKNGKIPLRSFL